MSKKGKWRGLVFHGRSHNVEASLLPTVEHFRLCCQVAFHALNAFDRTQTLLIKLECFWSNSNTFNQTPSIKRPRSNAFGKTASIECLRSNAFDRTPSIECLQSNAFNRTPSIERLQSNAFGQTPSIERLRSNPFDQTLGAWKLGNHSTLCLTQEQLMEKMWLLLCTKLQG